MSDEDMFHDYPSRRTSEAERLHLAVHGLAWRDPQLSAAFMLSRRGLLCLTGVALAIGALGFAVPIAGHSLVLLLLTIPFLCLSTMRLCALVLLLIPPKRPRHVKSQHAVRSERMSRAMGRGDHLSAPVLPDHGLPRYAVLVPIYREADSIPGLVQSLMLLDYPRALLDIVFILEADDHATQHALARYGLPGFMRTVVVPPGQPRTKPRALNYALQGAAGDLVVVYDAEDAPEPDQLKKAVNMFAAGDARLACLQARLSINNRADSWFSRQFAIEYSVLFGALLPVLRWLRFPIPLGGTSNHFRRHVLENVGGWDAFNVTEDADLGLRLARAGYAVEMLNSTTWEEAPVRWRVWRGQRRRWLKGWLQTLIVHTREPLRLASELGARGTIGFYTLMAGLVLSALVHPWVFVLGGMWLAGVDGPGSSSDALTSQLQLEPTAWTWSQWLWAVAIVNLVLGYASAIGLAWVVCARDGWRDLCLHCLMMPVYWLLISAAAYMAIIELVRMPHHWEKTVHRARPVTRLPRG
ncbi:MAG: glycosyltransferase [Pseudomonadota bacterium]